MKIIIGADLVPTETSEPLFEQGEAEKLFTDVLPLMQKADRTIVNLECALTVSENAIKKFGPNLKASPKCAETLKKAGITEVALSNNHVFDFGTEGLLETMQCLEKAGVPYMGVGANDQESRKIYYIEQDGKKVAFVNVCEHEYTYATETRIGANPYDPYLTMQDIREAKKQADFVVVLYHGGKEHCRYPSPRLRNLCHEMAYCGANAVITQHSHCIGCYEEFEGCHILYGQGNFHFAKNYGGDNEMWNTCLLVGLEIDEKVSMHFYPLVLDPDSSAISLAKGERAETILKPFYERNEELKTGAWKEGWKAFCESVKETYENAAKAMGKADGTEWDREWFCHYLDCEAHTDVWRELFQTWNGVNK